MADYYWDAERIHGVVQELMRQQEEAMARQAEHHADYATNHDHAAVHEWLRERDIDPDAFKGICQVLEVHPYVQGMSMFRIAYEIAERQQMRTYEPE